jgi:hypothetical protein
MQRWVRGCAFGALTVASFAVAPGALAAPAGKASNSRTNYQYACGQWIPEEPKPAQALFDVLFPREGAADDPASQAQLDAITGLGGKIVHAYRVPMVRARLRVGAVGLLEANSVTLVRKSHEHPVDALIGMDTPLSDEDREFLESAGAVVVAEFDDVINAIVPDEAIPAIRARPGVEYLDVNRIRCPAGSPP